MGIHQLLIAWAPGFVFGIACGIYLTPRLSKKYTSRFGYVLLAYSIVAVVISAAFSMWWAPLPHFANSNFLGEVVLALAGAALRILAGFALVAALFS